MFSSDFPFNTAGIKIEPNALAREAGERKVPTPLVLHGHTEVSISITPPTTDRIPESPACSRECNRTMLLPRTVELLERAGRDTTYLCGRSPFTWELATRLMLSWIQTFCLQTLSQSSRTQASIRSADVKDSLIRNTLGFVLSIYNSCAKPAMLAVISVGLTNLMKTIIMVIHVIASQ